jgi:arylsulfatase A
MGDKGITRRKVLGAGLVLGAATLGYAGARRLPSILESISPAYAGEALKKIPITRTPGFDGAPPNIVLILCDDMGYGDPGCYGDDTLRTPNIDSLARDGIRFTDSYASASLCTPSRIGLLTGRYAVRTGLTFPLQSGGTPFLKSFFIKMGRAMGRLGAIDLTRGSSVDGIPEAEITIADALKVAGYRTGMIGKWHLGDFSVDPQYHPMRHGFDEFFGTPMTNDELPNPLYRNETMLEEDIGLNQARLSGLSTKEGIDFILRSKDKQPFFLYMAYHAPHLPLFATEEFKDKSEGGIYGDVVEELDANIGKILSCLRENGLQDNTMVIFTSDNGPWYNGDPGNEFRGRKGQSYEGGFRVPLIVRWPGHVEAGTLCGEPTMNIDHFPTLLALAGLGLPDDRIIDGKSIAGLLTGREAKSPHDALYFYHSEQLEGIRTDHWKYFRHINHYTWPVPMDKPTTFLGKASGGEFLGEWPNLYNLETDEGENYDLASRYPDVCAKLDAMMTEWEKEMEKNPGGWLGNGHGR